MFEALKTPKLSNRNGPMVKWVLVAVLFLTSAFNYGDRSVLSSIIPLLQHEFHASDLAIGLLGTAFLWSYAIGVLFGGYLGDTLSRSKLITFSLVGWSAATLLVGLSHSFSQLALFRILLGITESFYIPASLALIADYHKSATRGTALALNLSGMSVGLIVSAAASGWLAERYGWRLPFVVLGALGLCLAPLSWSYVNDVTTSIASETKDTQPMRVKLAQLLAYRSYVLIAIESMLTSSGAWIFWTWLPLYYHDVFHLNLSQSGFSGTFVLQSAAVAAIIIGGYLSDRIAAVHPKKRLLALSLFYFGSVPFQAVFFGRPSFFIVSSGIFLSSFIRTLGQAGENPVICELLPERLRSTGLGVVLAGNMAGGGVAVLFAGYVKKDHGLNFAFLCAAGLVIVAALIAIIAYLFFVEKDFARKVPAPESTSAFASSSFSRGVC